MSSNILKQDFRLIKLIEGTIAMKSNAKAFIALSLGFIFLTLAISANQFNLVQEIINRITDSATAGIPKP
ncbi:MAG: hypothetical protein ACTSR2_01640 [Candidatus Hodarchaeales archaeon]